MAKLNNTLLIIIGLSIVLLLLINGLATILLDMFATIFLVPIWNQGWYVFSLIFDSILILSMVYSVSLTIKMMKRCIQQNK